MRDENGQLKISTHVAIWLMTLAFFFGGFVATIEARDYTQTQIKELRNELKGELEKINQGITKINDHLLLR